MSDFAHFVAVATGTDAYGSSIAWLSTAVNNSTRLTASGKLRNFL
jgi:hypothetical protein